MWIVDTALKARADQNRPIRVGIVGAGFMCQGLTNQIVNSTPGMRVVAISNRRPERAVAVFKYAGREDTVVTESQSKFDNAAARARPIATGDPMLLARSPHIDVLVDVTGSVEYGAHVVLEAFRYRKDVVLMNAELDATIGPILQTYADQHGVILTGCEGDEPGVQMNLYRWVKGLGLTPRLMGNVKGLQDPYRNPTTQQGFAERWGQNAAMVTSFADGSKISFEQSIVANATGFKVRSRGMSRGLQYTGDVLKIGELYDVEELRKLGGAIDYVVGTPLTKVYCLAEHPDPKQRHYLSLYKMGSGPLYSFFIPYHLVHFEAPNAIARAVLFRDPTTRPLGGPVVEVCAVAKRDLKAGEVLDDYGMYMTYGEAVNADEMSAGRYLPEGLVQGCRLKRGIAKDAVITYDDVVLPAGRLADQLRAEQYRKFRGETWLKDLLTAPQLAEQARQAAVSADI
ncbi:NAD(P)-dependent oxidoreductase [Bradyrhizobium sediminis]|uniref:NAD(P)-dependent oxidoreductase n=1 Tax=Bradyrhizobium sediminis TaxID=2840469 RepID=A0A975RP93_9BRAD|nr:Gfo/Idh/MocA family oxidoreductase [Bradyrhizobium sediminis]QWG14609.1 NAD(P)-dependent oxidoreductase [Bradyrhizobium sediminis]